MTTLSKKKAAPDWSRNNAWS